MGKFASSLNKTGVKTNNHAASVRVKAAIRQHVLDEVGASAAVLDAFAGDGAMWRAVWHKAAAYVGCDRRWYRDDRTAFVADNRRVLRAIALDRFAIFDLDAWGSPWEQALIIAARRPVAKGERLGLVLTDGSALGVKLGNYPAALRLLARVRPGAAGGSRSGDELMNRAIAALARRMRCRVLRRWQAKGKTGAQVAYVGLVLEGL